MNHSIFIPYKFRFLSETNKQIINEINCEYTNNFNNKGFISKKIDSFLSKFIKSYKPFVNVNDLNKITSLKILINAIKCNILLDFDVKRQLTIQYHTNYNYNSGMSSQIITNITQNNVEIFYEIFDFSHNHILDYDEFTLRPGEYILVKPNTQIRFNSPNDLLVINLEPKYIKYGLIMVPEYDNVFKSLYTKVS